MLLHNPLLAGGLLLLETEVLQQLDPFRQRSSQSAEAGGILIGYRRDQHLHVVEATTPAPLDRRQRFEFERLDPSHEHVARRRWKTSRHRLDYVGEWHTHPQVHPVPSSMDRFEWLKILRDRHQPMIFAIAGTAGWWIGLGHRGRIEAARLVHDAADVTM